MVGIEKSFVKGYKYRIYPDTQQAEYLNKVLGSCRFVWNTLLVKTMEAYEAYKLTAEKDSEVKKPVISGYSLCKELTKLKSEKNLEWLYEIPAVSLQQSALALGTAFNHFFKGIRKYPIFKKKNAKELFRLVGTSYYVCEGGLRIARLNRNIPIGFGRSTRTRPLPSKPTSCTISRTPTGKYYASFTCEYEPEIRYGEGVIGIDLGLKDFIVTSAGVRVKNPKHLAKYAKRLAKAQQRLARCRTGSIRRSKAKLKVAKLYEKVNNARNDFQHQLSRKLINENQVIGVETLRVGNLLKNHNLARAISDVAWSDFVRKLVYKARESQHTTIVKMHTFYPSSHLCNVTGLRVPRKLKLSEREWDCPHCDDRHDRDINAALNIRNFASKLVVGTTQYAGAVVLAARE